MKQIFEISFLSKPFPAFPMEFGKQCKTMDFVVANIANALLNKTRKCSLIILKTTLSFTVAYQVQKNSYAVEMNQR